MYILEKQTSTSSLLTYNGSTSRSTGHQAWIWQTLVPFVHTVELTHFPVRTPVISKMKQLNIVVCNQNYSCRLYKAIISFT